MINLDLGYTTEYREAMYNLFELAGFCVELNRTTGEVMISPDEVFAEDEAIDKQIEIINYLVNNGIMNGEVYNEF